MERVGQHDPEQVGAYSIVAKLGSGGMGSVYLGKRGIDQFAIKVINSALLGDKTARKRFAAEVETLRKLDSPFIARVVDSDVEAELPWLAMELVIGPSLKDLVTEKGPLEPGEWSYLAEDLLSALQELRSKGVIHRDIKPSNILVTTDGPKLIDFGISTALDQTSITTTGAVVGSPAWLAPEQLEGTTVTSAADAFSLGSVLTYAATGQSPWGDEKTLSAPTVFKRILDSEPDLENLQPFQRDVVLGLMHPRPSARLDPKEALRKLANRSESDKEIAVVLPTQRRKSWVGIAAATIGVLVIGAVGWALIPETGLRGGLGSTAQLACVETHWVGQDLSGSAPSAIEAARQRGSILTLECSESSDGAPFAVEAEFCQAIGDPDPASDIFSLGPEVSLRRISGDEELTPIFRSWNASLDNRHGCRSFVEIGKQDWEESLKTTLSYQIRETISAEGLEAGYYILASDNDGGTFVTFANYQPKDSAPRSFQLSADFFGPVAIEVAYESGAFPDWARTGDEYVRDAFGVVDTRLSYYGCWHEDYLAELEAESASVEFQALTESGDWVAVPASWDGEGYECEGVFKFLALSVNEHSLLPFLTRNQCTSVRLFAPETSGFSAGIIRRGDHPVLCVTLEASRIPVGQEVVTDEEISLIRAKLDEENQAKAGSFSDWKVFIERTVYPGLYATDSEKWERGMVKTWDIYQGVTVSVQDRGILPDPEWVHPPSPCSVDQAGPPPGRTFLVRGTEGGVPVSFHYTILDGKVYRFFDACDFDT